MFSSIGFTTETLLLIETTPCTFLVPTSATSSPHTLLASCISYSVYFPNSSVRTGFFFISRLLWVLHAVGGFQKEKVKKHTEHERMHAFGTLSTRGMSYTHAPHTDHECKYLFGSDIYTCQA